MAREDKIRSPEFLKAVAAILRAVPEAGYVWTGSRRDPEIEAFFAAQGVAGRCHFAGWIDAPLYASAFDAFSPALLQGGPRAVKASISADF